MLTSRMQFKLTKAAKNRVLRLLSKDNSLDVCLKRLTRNTFRLTAQCDGCDVFEMNVIKLNVGDEFVIDGLKSVIDASNF